MFILFPDDIPVDDRNCEYCVHCCINYDSWLSFQNVLYKVVKDPLFELFITLCIVLNTTFLALEHHGMSETVRSVLDIGNKVNDIEFRLQRAATNDFDLAGLHSGVHRRVHPEAVGSFKRIFPMRLEHIRPVYRGG